VVHPNQVVVHRLRHADTDEVVADRTRTLGQPVARIGRVVAADVEKVPSVERLKSVQRPVQIVVAELVATRAEDAGRGVGQTIEEVRRLAPEIDGIAGQQSLDAVAQTDDRPDLGGRLRRSLKNSKERTIDDGGGTARLADDQCATG
jgi:hypothetical protein